MKENLIFRISIIMLLLLPSYNLMASFDLKACEKMTSLITDNHGKKALIIEDSFQEELLNIKKANDLNATILKNIILTTQLNLGYEYSLKKNIEEIITIIHDVPFNKADQEYCDKKSALERMSTVKLKAFEKNRQQTLDEIRHDISLFSLREDQGLAVIAVYSFGYSQVLDLAEKGGIQKPLKIGPLNDKQYFRVVKLNVGDYYWNRVKNYIPNSDWRIQTGKLEPGAYTYYDLATKDLSFHINAGKLNFTGVLVIDSDGKFWSGDLYDRATIVIELLEQDYPFLLKKYSIVNGFNENDAFINFFEKEKKRLKTKFKGVK